MQKLRRMGSRVSDILERAGSGRTVTAFCEDVRSARPELRASTEELDSVPTLVALEWERAPTLASELDEIRDALARAAASLWPNWYVTAEQRFDRSRSSDVTLSEVVAEIEDAAPTPSPTWLKRAWDCCALGQLPLVPPLTSAEQVRQLSRALDPRRLVFALSVAESDATDARIRGLARAAEWLANESQAKVILLVPLAWQRHPELDHVAYRSLSLEAEVPALRRGIPVKEEVRRPPERDGPHVLVGPVVGKPHPGSEVEQMLHAQLKADPDLGALFEFNQRLAVFGGKHVTPDLVWRQGGLVIELDGDEHCRPLQYNRDRDRDYRLYMSGYLTLRITNDEVHAAPDNVLEKIRNVVNRLRHRELRHAHRLST